ncbi:hypothetical protein BH10PLA2_BH10PLA2_25020 [soil metagenome]
MVEWSKEGAMDELLRLSRYTTYKEGEYPNSTQHTYWLLQMTRYLEEAFGPGSLYYRWFTSIQWTHRGPLMMIEEEALIPGAAQDRYDLVVFKKGLGRAMGIIEAIADDLERVGIKNMYRSLDGGREARDVFKILNLAEVKLRKVLRNKPENESTVQDAFENLLVGAGIPYSRDKEAIEYSSKTYYPDFTLPKSDLAVEIKFSNSPKHEKEFIAQINDDIVAYKAKYPNLIFVVYDCGFIRDVERFTESFEAHGSVYVRVVKH